jgi:sugar phosphate isomerase/epimerase
MMKTRIKFISFVLIALIGSTTFAQNNSFKGRLAVQLWSFREDFKKDVPGTLKRVRALGFTRVELAGFYGMSARQFKGELLKAGLVAVSMHVEFDDAKNKIDKVIKDAQTLGITQVGVPWINSPFTKKDCEEAITVFNRAGEKMAAQGITFFYHLHGYEFVPNEGGAGTLFEYLMAQTNPKFVKLQMDTLHVAHPGQDPAKLLQKYSERFVSIHLKDVRKDIEMNNSGTVKDEDGRPMGQGKIDWSATLKAAKKANLQWYIIEDETPTVWDGVAQSLKFLDGNAEARMK